MSRKIQICFIFFIVIGLLIGGTSTAYFADDIKVTEAKFTAGTVKVAFNKDMPEVDALTKYVDNQMATWSIKNIGNNSVFLRVRPIADIDLEGLQEDEETRLEAVRTGWEKGSDNYYYYSKPVVPDETVDFCLEIYFNIWTTADLQVDIEVEAIQEANNAINQEWPKNPLNDK